VEEFLDRIPLVPISQADYAVRALRTGYFFSLNTIAIFYIYFHFNKLNRQKIKFFMINKMITNIEK
jgi:hypothetical protein